MDFNDLSKDAQTTVLGMVEYCLNMGLCMGMDEGLFRNGSPQPFRQELEQFVTACEGQTDG